MKQLFGKVSGDMWSYIVNEHGNGIRITIEEHGSCTPVSALEDMIRNLSPDGFEKLWQECEQQPDIQD